ncbi:MAG: DUF5060 domain-containing protein [Kiritimatiellaeota bacterium]|nr:DUF5060 domain-containing protein [Kiritimatiellota bacterium]
MKWILCLAALWVCGAASGAPGFRVFSSDATGASAPRAQDVTAGAEYVEWLLEPGEPGLASNAGALVFEVFIDKNAPASVQSLVHVTDREGRRFQSLQHAPLTPGQTNRVTVAMDADAPNWQAVGHTAAWQLRVRKAPREIGLRFFSSREPWEGGCVLLSAAIVKTPRAEKPPEITNLRAPTHARVRELYEIRFDLPDRYIDPFNPAEINITAIFTSQHGHSAMVHGFYYQDHFRVPGAVFDRVAPQGRGEWRVRFAPDRPGEWAFSLTARDAYGVSKPVGLRFMVADSDAPMFVRVSAADPRYFETTDGAFFYPIGHNIRSPFDTRMDNQFPFRLRHDEGTTVYRRYFKDMAAAGQNIAEVWMCAWSLGIEWSAAIPGYFGAGDYNLANAWEMDEVLRWARESGLRINLVLNNHGRVGDWCDPEWNDHPYNRRQGGWLDRATDFFSDPRAIEMQKRLYRYTVARWGWDATIFAWELMSELDLVGSDWQSYTRWEIVEWHRIMANTLRQQDPNRHLVTTHFSTDHTKLPENYGHLRELDFHGLDAYHNGQPENVVNLILASCQSTEKYKKPVVINEFGGSPNATSIHDLRRELHAALWASCASPMAGTPFIWWWHVVDEYDLYPMFTRVRDFMAGVDKRDPLLRTVHARVEMPAAQSQPPLAWDRPAQPRVEAVCMASPTHAIGWLWAREAYTRASWDGRDFDIQGVKVTLNNLTPPVCRVSWWDTQAGEEVKRERLRPVEGRLELFPPPFTRDIAFKIAPVTTE